MEYNTQREKLFFTEYGRNIRKMVDYALTIEDREKRNVLAKAIINVMAQVSPHSRDISDYKHKLWDQLFIISDFKLDVDSPFPILEKEVLNEIKPAPLTYNGNHIKYRHYGRNMEQIIAKVIEYPDGEEKETLIELIAHNLKKLYLNWNRDSVNDELIYEQFNEMTHGELKLSDNFQLLHTREYLSKSSSSNSKSKTSNSKQFRSHSSSKTLNRTSSSGSSNNSGNNTNSTNSLNRQRTKNVKRNNNSK